MSKNDALLPCPFCGASASGYTIEAHTHSGPLKALGIPDHGGSYVIEGDCACGSGLIGETQTEVTGRWNRRAASCRPSDLVNTAGILASDAPSAVVRKLDAAYDLAKMNGGL